MAEFEEQGSWLDGLTNEKLTTPEAKQSLSKYTSHEDALAGTLEASRMVGKKTSEYIASEEGKRFLDEQGFIKPPSKDAKPEDIESYRGLLLEKLGTVNEESLKDFNFAIGLPEGKKPDPDLSAAYGKFIIESKMPKDLAEKSVQFVNEMSTKYEQMLEAQFIENAKKSDEAMIADPSIGTVENMNIKDELVRRMFQNDLELTAAEYEAIAPELVKAGFTQNQILRKSLYRMADKLSSTTSHENGEGGAPKEKELSKYEQNKARWPNTPDLWGSPDA